MQARVLRVILDILQEGILFVYCVRVFFYVYILLSGSIKQAEHNIPA